MTTSLREQFDIDAQPIPALGDIDAALAQVATERRRARRLALASVAAAAAVVVVVSGVATRRGETRPVAPTVAPAVSASPSESATPSASPSPSTVGPPVEITVAEAPPRLDAAPLVDGADAVLVASRLRPTDPPSMQDVNARIIAQSGGQQRLVAAVFQAGPVALRPDGRVLAFGEVRNGVAELVHLVDLTTGREVWQEQVDLAGTQGDIANLEWSADGRLLVEAVRSSTLSTYPGFGELRALEIDRSGRVARRLAPLALPGPFLAVDATGSTVAAASTSTGSVVTASISGGSSSGTAGNGTGGARGGWSGGGGPTSTPPGFPAPPVDGQLVVGQHRWSPDGTYLAWSEGAAAGASGTTSLGVLSWRTGQWTTWRVDGAVAQLLGWSGEALLVQRQLADGTADVGTVAIGGPVVVVTIYRPTPGSWTQAIETVSLASSRTSTAR
jgi:hypothetical protein